jgi:hypothetical protein
MTHADQQQVLLFGLDPGGHRLAARVEQDHVHTVESLQEYLDYTHERADAGGNAGRRISSVVVVARDGDNVEPMPTVYRRALEMRALVTTIVVADDGGRGKRQKSSAFFTALRGTSDMTIATSDEDYVQFMLDCLA